MEESIKERMALSEAEMQELQELEESKILQAEVSLDLMRTRKANLERIKYFAENGKFPEDQKDDQKDDQNLPRGNQQQPGYGNIERYSPRLTLEQLAEVKTFNSIVRKQVETCLPPEVLAQYTRMGKIREYEGALETIRDLYASGKYQKNLDAKPWDFSYQISPKVAQAHGVIVTMEAFLKKYDFKSIVDPNLIQVTHY